MEEKVQNSQNKEVNRKLTGKFTVNFPDGGHIHLPIFEGESFREKIKDLVDQWYLDIKKEPDQYGHFDVKDKCPKCGGPLRFHFLGNLAYLWCINDGQVTEYAYATDVLADKKQYDDQYYEQKRQADLMEKQAADLEEQKFEAERMCRDCGRSGCAMRGCLKTPMCGAFIPRK